MRAVPDSHNYRKHEEASRDLERRFGHERVQGAHAERIGKARPDRTPSRAELRQQERTGIIGKQVKQEVSAAFRASDGPEAFRVALREQGYEIARGDRRDYVIVDRGGGIHSLARRIDGVKAAELRAFMAPLAAASIPTIEQARAVCITDDDDARRHKAYGRGGYVSQSRAALKEHRERQEQLDRRNDHDALWDRIDTGEARREREQAAAHATDEERPSDSKDETSVRGDIDMTDAMRARLDRLREAKAGYSSGPGAARQTEAPGGGHTRSR
jgi:hypothetical protein